MRIFVRPLVSGELTVRGDEHRYVAYVRRARPGDAVELVDGEGSRASAQILRIGEAETVLQVGAIEAVPDLPPRIRVLIPAIKGDRMDTCIEKLVEVGVDEIVVWPAARAVVKLEGERRTTRIAHYQAAAQAAARQSGRASIPRVSAADSLAAALAALPAGGIRLVLDPAADRAALPIDAATPSGAKTAAGADDLTIASGPEGGFAPAELETFAAAGFIALGLGPRVLRAETAPVIAVALVRATTHS